jgi:dTDP-4-amino-4,6-dideoxygalactose transaminase
MSRAAIPAQRYDVPDEDIDAVLERFGALLRSHDFLTMGRYGEEFERRFAAYTGARHAVAVSSGTAALELILRSIGVAGAEVVVPTNTFAATAFAVIHAGGRPVFADCGDDLVVDPVDVERRLSRSTKAVIVVHIGGLISPSVVRLKELCREREIPLVEDAAHAHGSRLEGMQAGTISDAAGFSFFSTKVITTGEGGMVVTDDATIADQAALLRDQAKVAGQNLHREIGHNWRMSEFQAILGLTQLDRLDGFIAQRRRVARIYDDVLGEATDRLRPLRIPSGAEPNYYKYVLFTSGDTGGPAEIAKRLKSDHGLSLGGFVYDVPLHRQPVFRPSHAHDLPRAEDLCRRHVCPPIYPSLTDEEASYVAECLLKTVS